jgi:hypothetical protein
MAIEEKSNPERSPEASRRLHGCIACSGSVLKFQTHDEYLQFLRGQGMMIVPGAILAAVMLFILHLAAHS